MCNTGAEERASFSASKLASVSAVHVNRAVGLPSAVSGLGDLGVALHETAVVVSQPCEATNLAAQRRRPHLTMDCTLRGSTDTSSAESRWPKKPSSCRPNSHLGALGVELPVAEDLEHLGDVEQMLFQPRRVHQTIVHIIECTPAQRARAPRDPAVDRREALSWCDMRRTSGPVSREVETDGEGLMTRISSEEAPCRPKGTTFHSKWPSCNRKIVFHRSAARTRSG